MTKKICVILPWNINEDSRAQRTALSLSSKFFVDIFCLSDNPDETKPFLINNLNITRIKPISRKILDRFYLPFYSSSILMKNKIQPVIDDYDIIYCHDLPALLTANKLKLTRQKIIYDIHDLYIETVNQGLRKEKQTYLMKFKVLVTTTLFRYFIKKTENKYIRYCDLIFSVNVSISKYISDKYNLACETIENFPIKQELPKEKKLRKLLGISKVENIVIYHGNLGGGRYLKEIVKSAFFFNQGISLVIMGNGELKENLKTISGVNTYFLNSVPYENLFQYTSDANLGIVLLEHINYSKKHASANKLFEYMACGIPVLISNSPELMKVVKKEGNGVSIDEISPFEIAKTINKFFENHTSDKNLGYLGRKAFENKYNWNTQECLLLELVEFKNKIL
jgi:glycosyltransferase involved in cell wall biosynthesis